mgnify:CR=1 FL=1
MFNIHARSGPAPEVSGKILGDNKMDEIAICPAAYPAK